MSRLRGERPGGCTAASCRSQFIGDCHACTTSSGFPSILSSSHPESEEVAGMAKEFCQLTDNQTELKS